MSRKRSNRGRTEEELNNEFKNDVDNKNDVDVKDKNVNIAKVINSGNSKVDVNANSIQDQDQD